MAERITDFQVPPPPPTAPSAQEALDRLVETLHARGVLRLATDMVARDADIARVLLGGLNQPGTQNALQNLSVLLMALSQIPPAKFYHVTFALKDALLALAHPDPEQDRSAPPGLRGGYRLLHDDALWDGLGPILAALRRFGEGLDRPVEKPISAFSGKQAE